jgi:hypothetical protein
MAADMSFRYLKQFFLVKIETGFSRKIMNMGILEKCINTDSRTTTKKILIEIHFSKIPIFIIFLEKPVSILTRKNCFRYLKLIV